MMKLIYSPVFFILLSFGLATASPLRETSEDYELEFDLDEHFEEMTADNIQPKSTMDDLVGESAFHSSGGTEIINEDAIDEEVRRGDERSNYAPWKVILMVGGTAVGLVAIIGAIIVVLKNVRKPGSSKVPTAEP